MQDPILTPIFATYVVAGSFTIGATSISFASVLSAATLLAGTVALNYALSPDAPKPEQGTIPLRQTIPSRIVGFGEVRVAGSYVLYEMFANASHDVIGLCQGPAGGFKAFYLDDKLVTVNAGTGHANSGLATGAYGTCQINVRLGASLETAHSIPELAAIWTADHRGDRVVSLYLRAASISQKDFLKFFPNGLPKPSAVLFLPCWDFRDGDQDADDPDTWIDYPAYSAATTYAAGDRVLHGGVATPGVAAGGMLWLCLANGTVAVAPGTNAQKWAAVWKNPVLQAVTFIVSQDIGMGLPRSRLITPALAALTAEADKCDVAVLRDDASYETRYASCPWWKMETEPDQVLGQIFASCDGWVSIDGDGALSIKVGVYSTPTVTLDDGVILGVELAYGVPDEDKIDELTLSFTSPDHDYTTQAIDAWRDEDAILNRGKVRSQAFGPTSVQSPSQLRRLAKRIFLRGNALRGTIVTHLGGMIAAGQRYVTIDYPDIPELDGAVVELRRRETDLAARQCRFEFVLVDPATLEGWVPAIEEGAPPSAPDIIDPETLPVPENVEAEAGGSPPFHIVISWDDPERDDLSYLVRYRLTDFTPGVEGPWSDGPFSSPTIAGGRISVMVYPTTDDSYEIQVASIGPGTTASDWAPSVFLSTDLPALDYSRPQNSAKWLFLNGF